MKKILMLAVMLCVLSTVVFAGNRYLPTDPAGPNLDRLQFTRNAKELTTNATCYAVTLNTYTVTVLPENLDRERLEIVNLSTYTVNVMVCSSFGTNPSLATVQANSEILRVYTANDIGTNKWSNDIYVGKVAICCDSAIAGMAGVTQKILVVEYEK